MTTREDWILVTTLNIMPHTVVARDPRHSSQKTVAVIGAGGFLGQHVVRLLLQCPQVGQVRAFDRVHSNFGAHSIVGDLINPEDRARAIGGADVVIHLAAVLGGAAETNPELSRSVNIDATLDLISEFRAQNPIGRFVFASSIAAFGQLEGAPVDDATPLEPMMLYGAHKVMIEVFLSRAARSGWLDAVSLRVSGLMARQGADEALKSAFMSRLFHAVARGIDIDLPVAPESRTWMTSVLCAAQNFVHAALVPDLGANRAFTLPALCLDFETLVAALYRRFPQSGAKVAYCPDPETIAAFGNFPPLITQTADRLGFIRDTDADALVAQAFD